MIFCQTSSNETLNHYILSPWLEVHQEPRNKVWLLSPAERLMGLWFQCNDLTHLTPLICLQAGNWFEMLFLQKTQPLNQLRIQNREVIIQWLLSFSLKTIEHKMLSWWMFWAVLSILLWKLSKLNLNLWSWDPVMTNLLISWNTGCWN